MTQDEGTGDFENIGDTNDDGNESKIEVRNKKEGPCEADIEKSKVDALMRQSVTNGKVRKILGTVLAIQSWPYNVKKEPPMPTPSGTTASDVSHGMACTYMHMCLPSSALHCFALPHFTFHCITFLALRCVVLHL